MFFSFLMLKLGLSAMCLRYPLAVGLSYLVFLGLLRLWLGCQTTDASPASTDDDFGVTDALLNMPDFGDGNICIGTSSDGSAGDAIGALELDELLFVVVAVVSIGAGLLVCLYLVWTGPALLAEVLVDGLLMARVYTTMKGAGQSYWMSGALRRTWFPAILVAVFFAVAGFAMQKVCPDAKSIGSVIAHVIGREL